ncbi:MAG: DUF4340 domain-containing protein [Labilithrix sp.]|nr:DUF4340 domain-containing protein [Labilithrix sp.]MCW5815433.1 DUF4340 domain-containing protein [Labilithrix sp.]
MRRHVTTIVLFVAAIVLGVYFWRDRASVSEGERRSRENNVFPAWRREELSRIEIAHEGEALVLVREKADAAWRMTSPRNERVDQQAVERLATTLEFATRVRKLGSGDESALGFAAPRASGAVTMGALSFRFVLGGVSPRPDGSAYLRIDDGDPFVASKELAETLLAPSDTYRDRSVVPYLSLELARFEVVHAGGGFMVRRHDERSFDVPDLGVLASRTALDKAWSALAEMRAEAFPKDSDADRLTASPRMTIRMHPKDAAKPMGELVVGEACPGHPDDVVVLRKMPTRVLACAPKGAIEQLAAITPDWLVDRRPFSFRHDEIEELRLEGGDAKPIEIARKGTGFHEREPVDRDRVGPDAEGASELLVAIERTEALEVKPGGKPFTAIAKARVRASSSGAEHEETVEVGTLGGETVELRRVRDDARLTVSAAAARRFVPRETTLRPLALLNETRRVTRVVLRCGEPQELVDAGEGLRLVEPRGYETDGSVSQLVDGLVRGKVLAWTADRDDGTFGLGPDACRVVLGFADGNTPVTVSFGKPAEGGVYGNVDGRPEVFVAPSALEELAKRIYVSRAALRVAPEQVASVAVTVKGQPAALAPSAQLREAAGSFYAERAVKLGTNDVGAADVEIVITVADGGAPKRVSCATSDDTSLRCATPDVRAVFEVKASTVARFVVSPRDARDARDAAVDAE